MLGKKCGLLILGLVAVAAAVVACSEGDQPLVANDVVGDVPWPQREVATYRVTQGDIVGECTLSVVAQSSEAAFSQDCAAEEFTDSVTLVVDAETLRPRSTQRTITGPDGVVTCEAEYTSSSVDVTWVSPEDERQSELSVPVTFYDTWGDLFLWRTIRFGEGYDQNYVDVASCTNPRAEPELVGVRLTTEAIEEVEVPLGTYETWHLTIRSEGHTQNAWYATEDSRTLVKYDNGDQVFELVSIE